MMNQRDWELLDKQPWEVSFSPPWHWTALGLAFVAVFLGGLSIGAILFAQQRQTQLTLHDATTVLSLLDGSPQR
jgi:hypothetical protein